MAPACLQFPGLGSPESQCIPPHYDNQERWAEPTRSLNFLHCARSLARRSAEQCACVPPAAHAQALGGPWRSKGEFKETGATRLRLPRPGRGYRHHAGDSGASYSGGSESGGGETCPGGRQAGHMAEVSRSWAQPCFNSADSGPRTPYPQPPNTNRSTPRTPLPQLRESPLQPAVARELSPPPQRPASLL